MLRPDASPLGSRLGAGALLGLLALLAWRSVVDIDVGLHLAGGRWIAEHARVPTTDSFTWTVSDHAYLAYHWLFQLGLHGVERVGGALGIGLLRWGALLATGLLLLDVVRGRPHAELPLLGVGLAALLMSEWRFLPRPELVSHLLLAATLWICERRRQGRGAPLWLLPPIQLLWVNTHIFALGWGVLGLYLLEEAIRLRSPLTPLWCWSALAALALLVNPYHVHAVLHPLLLITRLDPEGVFSANLREFAPPLAMSFAPGDPLALALWAWALLVALGALAAVQHLRRGRWLDAAVIALYAAFSSLAVRNGVVFAIATFPFLVWGLSELTSLAGRGRVQRAAFVGLLLFAALTAVRVVNGAFYQEARRAHRFGWGYGETLAIEAGDWLQRSDLVGPLFNNHNLGASLLWRTPRLPVFTDGRTEVSGDAFFLRAYRAATPEGFPEAEAEWAPELVALSLVGGFPLSVALERDPDWRLVYLDGVAAIFARVAGPNGHAPAAELPAAVDPAERMPRLRAIELRPGAAARLLRWLRPDAPAPGEDFVVGQLLLAAGPLAGAEAVLLRAAERSPHAVEVHYRLGLVYARQRLAAPAHRAFRAVHLLRPDDPRLAEIPPGLWAGPEVDLPADGG
jgi:hypothetical protein